MMAACKSASSSDVRGPAPPSAHAVSLERGIIVGTLPPRLFMIWNAWLTALAATPGVC